MSRETTTKSPEQFKHLGLMIFVYNCSSFPHLYSPNVPSSSFMGWISGSWCASSFSFTMWLENQQVAWH